MNKRYNFRLYPNKEQEILINKTFGCVRFIYNKMLAERIEIYEKYKNDKEKLKQQKYSSPAGFKENFLFLKEVDALALCNAEMNLNAAYRNFFRDKNIGFPKFKSKKNTKNTYTINNLNNNKSIRINNNKIRLGKLGFVKLSQHREINKDEIIKSCTISKTPSGQYYISVLLEYEYDIKSININKNKIIGLDFDMKNLYTDSDGKKANYPRYFYLLKDKLAKARHKLSKMKFDSNNYKKQKLKVSKIYQKIANQRKDFLHKKSKQLADNFDAIVIEDLNMKEMSQSLNLGKSVYDNAWGMFTIFLKYKLENQGKQLIKIDKWYPSSKTCSSCGYKKQELKLSERIYICEECGLEIDRDCNAAINIQNEGIRMLVV